MFNKNRYGNLKNGDRLRMFITGQSVMVIASIGSYVTVSSTYSDKVVGETYTYSQLYKKFWLYKRYAPETPVKSIWTGARMPRDEYQKVYQKYLREKKKRLTGKVSA